VLVGGAFKAAQAFEQDQMAVLRLQNTLDKMPLLAGATTDAFIEQANALQAVTKYGDDATISAQAMLGTFNMTEDQVLALTPLVQDYASKFGVDLVDASKQVGKAMMGQIAVLQRNGVTIDANLFKTDRFAAVTQALREQAGGFAEIEGKTMAGQLSILRNNFGDVVEVIGSGAVGAFNSMLGPVKSLGLFMKDLPPVVGQTVGGFAAFGGVALIVGGAASMIIGQMILMKERFTLALDAGKRLITFMQTRMTVEFGKSALKAGLLVAAVGAASLALGELFQKISGSNVTDLAGQSERLNAALDELRRSGQMTGVLSDVDALAERYRQLSQAVDIYGGSLRDAGAESIGEKILGINLAMDPLIRNARDARVEFEALDQALIETANGDGLPAAIEEFNLLRQRLIDAGVPAEAIADLLPDISARMEDAGQATGDASIEVQQLTEALKQQQDALNAMFDPVFAAIDATDGLRDAQGKATGAALEVAAAQQAHADALANFEEGSPEVVEAAFKLMEAQEKLRDAEIGAVEAAQRQDSALLALARSQAEAGGSTDAFEQQLQDWIDRGLITEEQARRVKDEFYKVRDAAGEIPPSTPANIDSNVGDVLAQLQALKEVATNTDLSTWGKIQALADLGRRELGGPVTARTPYLVGERGPELFVPDGSGRIIPDDETRRLMSGSEGGRTQTTVKESKTVNVYVNKSDASPFDIGRELLWQMKVGAA
jgi:polyhydroxyalkanoate synthesis regulator phasin